MTTVTDTTETRTAEASQPSLADYSVERIYASVIDTTKDIGSNDSATFTDHGLSVLFDYDQEKYDHWNDKLVERIYPAGFGGIRALDIRAPWVRKLLKRMWADALKGDEGASPFGFASLETRVSLRVAVELFEVFAYGAALRSD